MKKILHLIFISLSIISRAQDASVEKSVFGVQTSLLGLYIHNEFKLTDALALRSEAGFYSEFQTGSVHGKIGYSLNPVLIVEPRFYYNLSKRVLRSKDISNNSGNFVTLKTIFRPVQFVISNYETQNRKSSISIVPTWGLRRNIGSHFNYENGVGFGYTFFFANKAGYSNIIGEAAVNLHLRIGYVF